MDAHLKLAARQDELFARWQLFGAGWSNDQVHGRARREAWRAVHTGVYTRAQGPLTRRQRLRAATLTAPDTYLHSLSAADHYGFHTWKGNYETVVRPGTGGKRSYPGLLVARSRTLDGDVGDFRGLPVVRPERALIEIAGGGLNNGQLRRGFREASRLKCTTADGIARALGGQRGTAFLAALCDRYATIPYHRCRSDAECHGLEVLHDAGVPPPAVNVGVAGREADYVWRARRLIVEVHSKEFHPFAIDDEDKKRQWEGAGYRVRYVWANDIYVRPAVLVAASLG
jgi:hypothetical protein